MVDQLAFGSNQNPCNFEYAKIYAKQNFIVSALPSEEQYKNVRSAGHDGHYHQTRF